MATEGCPSDSHTTTAHNTVFIDTNLDTHLALMVSSSDTVFDLKKKIMYEHPRCFPNTGEIKIHGLKVKRKEYLYHLSDYMFVKSAFEGVKNNWFLSADASSLVEPGENFHSRNHDSTNRIACIGIKNNPSADGVDLLLPAGPPKRSSNFNDSSLPQIGGSPNMNQEVPVADRFGSGGSDTEVSKDLMMEVNLISKDHFKSSLPDANKRSDLDRKVSKDLEMEVIHESDDHFKASSSDTNKRSDPERQEKSFPCSNDYEVPGIRSEGDEDNSKNRISDVQRNVALEAAVKYGPAAKEKGKAKRKLEDALDDHTLEESNALVHGSGKDTSQQGIMVLENSLGDAGGPALCDMEVGNENISYEHDPEKKRKKSRKTKSLVGATQVTAGTEHASGSGSVIDTKDQPPVVVEGPHLDEKDTNIAEVVVTSNLLDANGTLEPGSKKKRKKSRKTKGSAGAKQVTAGTENASASGSVIDTKDQPPVVVNEQSHLVEKDANMAEVVVASNLLDANGTLGPDSEKKSKKSKKTKGSVGVKQVTASTENASASGSVIDTKDQPPVVVNEQSHLDEKDANIAEVVVASNLLDANGTLEPDSEKKRKKSRKTKSSVGATQVTAGAEGASASGSVTDTKGRPPVVVKEPSQLDEQDTNIAEVVVTSNLFDANGIMETDSERKKKKSRKTKSSVGATKVIPGSEVASGSGIFTEPQKAVNDDHSSDKAEIEGSVLPQREGKEVSKIVPVNADRKTDEVGKNEVESLLISKTQEKTESADAKKIRNAAAKSLPNMHMREQDGGGKDPEQSTDSTREVDASLKVSKKKTKSAKQDSMDRLNGSNMEPEKDIEGESKQINFNDYFVPPQHQNEVNASGTRAMLEKSNSTFSAPSSNLDSSKRVIHQEKRGNEHQSQVVNHPVPVRKVSKVVNRSENKKSLLATLGMIFKDDASESSDDKDEVYSSDASTRSPLDNSSSSDYSDVESNANFNSQQNGFHTSNGNESGGKGIIEPHSSGVKNLTLDTILRSSSRYKKAKLTASQLETESQPIDFVPDSQASQ